MIACKQNTEIDKIKAVMNKQEQAWNSGNIEQFMEGYWKSDSLMFIGKNGIQYGWQNTLDNYLTSYPNKEAMGQLKFTIIKLELADSSAYLLGKWDLARKTDSLGGYFTLYWKKVNNQWVITIDHTS